MGNFTSEALRLLDDPWLYRSAATAGEWRHLEFLFDTKTYLEGRGQCSDVSTDEEHDMARILMG